MSVLPVSLMSLVAVLVVLVVPSFVVSLVPMLVVSLGPVLVVSLMSMSAVSVLVVTEVQVAVLDICCEALCNLALMVLQIWTMNLLTSLQLQVGCCEAVAMTIGPCWPPVTRDSISLDTYTLINTYRYS